MIKFDNLYEVLTAQVLDSFIFPLASMLDKAVKSKLYQ